MQANQSSTPPNPMPQEGPLTEGVARVRFAPKKDFSRVLKQRVDDYFTERGLSKKDQPAMFWKTFTILGWFVGSYLLLLFAPVPWWGKVAFAISLGLAMAGVGFSIMHDGGHQSYSRHKWVNRATAYCLDVLGGSSYVWNWKHNVFHHTFPNITGHDDDLNVGPLARLSPQQPHFPLHHFQHFYMWVLYGFLPAKWHLFDDYHVLYKGKIGQLAFPRPKGAALVMLFVGKAFFYTWAFVVPALFYPLGWVVAFYLLATFVEGVMLAVVFQLAHCLEEADFPTPAQESNRIDEDWSIHQIQTTVDFAPNSKLLSWYVGGLNFQVEHHLFPKISHTHYPEIAKIVASTCEEYGIPYHCHESVLSSLRSHYRWLFRLGRGAVPA